MINDKPHHLSDGTGASAIDDDASGAEQNQLPMFSFDSSAWLVTRADDAAKYLADRRSKLASFMANKAPLAGDLVTSATSAPPTSSGLDETSSATVTNSAVVSATGTVATTSQIALGANVATALYGVTGAGLKIGIISDSYNAKGGAAADMSSSILPQVNVLSDSATGSDEGRAMIEVAYAIAPGATYYTADGGSLAQNVATLEAAGVNIIIDDLSVGGEALYQVGSDADIAIQTAVAANVDYFTSAGNNGNDYYEAGFTPVTTTINGIGMVVANNFGGGNVFQSLTFAQGAKASIVFQWAQPFGTDGSGTNFPANSLAIYLLDANGNIVGSSTTDEAVPGDNPTQEIDFTNNTSGTAFQLVVVQNGGTVTTGQLFKYFLNDAVGTINDPNAGKGSGDLLGHELLPGVNVVAAANYANTPAYGVSPTQLETFSSVGPGTILFDANGNALANPVTVGDPEFAATDGTTVGASNTNFATSPFFGTSAAAPAAGAVGALVLQADAALSTTQVTSVLGQSVIPIATSPGFNGAGLIQARAAVEIGANDVGARWNTAAGGNWSTGSSWSTGAAPTSAQGAILDDNLGGFTGTYTVTVNSGGQTTGSLAIAAPSGSSAKLSIASGGSLAVGGSPSANITANDFLVSDNGSLSVSGGTLTVAGTLNVNNGAVTVAAGAITAAAFAQDAGLFSIGGAAIVSFTGSGLAETGGAVSVLANAVVNTTLLTLSSASISVAGKLMDTGALSIGGNGTAGTITLQSGGELDIGAGTDADVINFAGPSLLDFTSTDANTLNVGLNDVISGFTTLGDLVDFTGLAYDAQDTLGFSPGTNGGPGDLSVFSSSGSSIAQLFYAGSGNYSASSFRLTNDSANHVEIAAACYCVGTLIATDRGDVAIEDLRIGDVVMTASGGAEKIRWIGWRSYAGRFMAGNRRVLPVRIRAGALGENVPRRDLRISPLHAMFIDGALVPAVELVNGVSITQEMDARRVHYVHLELTRHDVILAEGAASESFVDDDSRAMFHNVAEFSRLYPDAKTVPATYCAPRLVHGYALDEIRRKLAQRAGLRREVSTAPLRGHLDHVGAEFVEGWAQDCEHLEAPVCLDILVDGVVVARTLASRPRADLAAAGLGSGRHGFKAALSSPISAGQMRSLEVRRSSDGALLHRSAANALAA